MAETLESLQEKLSIHIENIKANNAKNAILPKDQKKVLDFKRSMIYCTFKKIYNMYLDRIKQEDIELNETDLMYKKLHFLIKKSNELERKTIPESPTRDDRLYHEIELDAVRYNIEELTKKGLIKELINNDNVRFQYYPEYSDIDFNKYIYGKKEFNKNKIPLITPQYIKERESHGFEKSPTQKFVKNFISEHTPYNGLLLWHDVGVGKTCAGIGIAENFRDSVYSNNTKILVLTPSDTLQQNWRDEIINVEKELIKLKNKDSKNVQCTGSRYTKELFVGSLDNETKIKREAKKLVDRYYEFYGYQKLARRIENFLEKKDSLGPSRKYPNKAKIQYIRENFSNRVIIMDEVHQTRDSGNIQDKLARPWIEMIMRYAENTKVILLTATPMYNISREIVWLLNILLLNDKRAPLDENSLFDRRGERLKAMDSDTFEGETALNILMEKSRGYISYLQGKNPFTFPLKLNPIDKNAYVPRPTYDKSGLKIEEERKITDMVFYSNTLSDWQYNYVDKYYKGIEDSNLGLEEIDITKSFAVKPTSASNIVFPLSNTNAEGEYIGGIGKDGFDKCFTLEGKKYSYNHHALDIDSSGKSFLHIDKIGKYSMKFYNIIKSVTSAKGIIFVFSQFIKAGVLPLALALEENGFTGYVGDGVEHNLLEIKDKDRFCAVNLKYESQLDENEKLSFRPAKYALLTAEDTSVKQRNQIVKEARGEIGGENINGEDIKIILGTRVVEQGVSLKRVREVHVLEPWHHLNQQHQAEGRAFRYKSHDVLPDTERNVTVYLHIARSSNKVEQQRESSDEYIYRRAFEKKKEMSNIEYMIKKNSVDCMLNKLGNVFLDKNYGDDSSNPLKNKEIVDSKNNKRILNLGDQDNSENCSFKECDYKCAPDSIDFDSISINSDTFNEFFAEDDITLVKEYIKTLFDREWVISEDNIVKTINTEAGLDIAEEFIFKALSDIIENKEIIYDMYKRPGFIIDRFGFYIFQPSGLEDVDIPMLYRYLFNYNKLKSIDLDMYYKKLPQKQITMKTQSVELPFIGLNEFTQIKDILVKVYKNAQAFINSERGFNDYPVNVSDIKNENEPLRSDLVKALFISYIEKFPNHHNINDPLEMIMKYAVTMRINNTQLSEIETTIVNIILDYYDTPHTNSFLIREKDLDPEANPDNNDIAGFLSYSDDYKLYLSNNKKPASLQQADIHMDYKKLKYDDKSMETHFPDNVNKIYGYVEKTPDNTPKFYIINKDDGEYTGPTYNKQQADGTKTISKKTNRTGAVCGTAKGAKTVSDLYDIINKIVGYKKHYREKSAKGFVHYPLGIKRNLKYSTKVETNFNDTGFSSSLCLEVELLLRVLESKHKSVSKNFRFFYKLQEKLILNGKKKTI